MAMIPLTAGFKEPENGVQVLKIVDVTYKEDYGKLIINLENEKGNRLTEYYSLLTKTGETNTKALNAFSYLAKTALQDVTRSEIDETELIGCYIKAEVYSQQATNKDGLTQTYKHIRNYEQANSFETVTGNATGLTLDDILGE